MKRLALLTLPLLAAACLENPSQPSSQPNLAVATAPGLNKLQCFDGTTDGFGYGGTCTLNSNGAKGSATLDLPGTNPAGDYAGVYTLESKMYGVLLTDLTQLSYHYTASSAPQPGNLSYNIPIDVDGNGVMDFPPAGSDFYAFVDAFYCPGANGVVDIIGDPNCGIWAGGVTFYANWAAFVAAYLGAKVATDFFVFIVAERTPAEPAATYEVNNVKFGKAGK